MKITGPAPTESGDTETRAFVDVDGQVDRCRRPRQVRERASRCRTPRAPTAVTARNPIVVLRILESRLSSRRQRARPDRTPGSSQAGTLTDSGAGSESRAPTRGRSAAATAVGVRRRSQSGRSERRRAGARPRAARPGAAPTTRARRARTRRRSARAGARVLAPGAARVRVELAKPVVVCSDRGHVMAPFLARSR